MDYDIDFPDNQDCIDLITAKPYSLFTLLDEECRVGDNNDTAYHRKVIRYLESNSRLGITNKMRAKGLFAINHYAGEVVYNTENFCFKNQQIMSPELLEILYNSKLGLVQSICEKLSVEVSKHSVNRVFQKQLTKLMKVISKTNTHYTRCIKPNDLNKPDNYNKQKVVEQLRYAGVLEAIKVARAGYPIRFKKTEFANDFHQLYNHNFTKTEIDTTMINILNKTNIKTGEYQIGLTKIFFKKTAFHEIENIRTRILYDNAIKLQSVVRCFINKLKYHKILSNILKIQTNLRRFFAVKFYKSLRLNYYAY